MRQVVFHGVFVFRVPEHELHGIHAGCILVHLVAGDDAALARPGDLPAGFPDCRGHGELVVAPVFVLLLGIIGYGIIGGRGIHAPEFNPCLAQGVGHVGREAAGHERTREQPWPGRILVFCHDQGQEHLALAAVTGCGPACISVVPGNVVSLPRVGDLEPCGLESGGNQVGEFHGQLRFAGVLVLCAGIRHTGELIVQIAAGVQDHVHGLHSGHLVGHDQEGIVAVQGDVVVRQDVPVGIQHHRFYAFVPPHGFQGIRQDFFVEIHPFFVVLIVEIDFVHPFGQVPGLDAQVSAASKRIG